MESLDRLISRLNRLPGIGIKTAQRLAYHIISLPDEDAAALANSIEDAHRLVHFCPICGNYTENEVCEICSDPKHREWFHFRRSCRFCLSAVQIQIVLLLL